MAETSADRNPIDELAEEFVARFRRGERPALSEYVRRYPELADEIREVIPALVAMEQLKPDSSDASAHPPSGERLDRIGDYRILREIGRGGMGIVYEAEQVSLGRHVALKVLPHAGRGSPTYLERFRREAKAAGKLHHTNIVPVFGVGESDGVHYYAMQYIHGEGLDRVLRDLRVLRKTGPSTTAPVGTVAQSLATGRFALGDAAAPPAADPTPPPEAPSGTLTNSQAEGGYCRALARVGLQAAEALAYAHKQGVVHRDIKPANLILDLQGTVWITDFGLAKAEGSDELTGTGDIVGTVRYMAPERFEGASLPQGDVYALGVTLYEMLTLRPAFDDSNPGRLIQKIVTEDPIPPRQLDRSIPRDLETIVLKAIAREAAARYASAEVLADDLRRFLSDRPIRARRTPLAERFWRWCRRNPAVASLVGVIACLLVGVALSSLLMALSLDAAKKDALDKLWRAKLNEANATVLSRQVGQRFTSLKRIEEALAIARPLGLTADDRLQLRNAAIAALALPDVEVIRQWDGHPIGTTGLEFDRQLTRYARAEKGGRLSVRRVSDDEELVSVPANGAAVELRLSGDGRYVVRCQGSGHWKGAMELYRVDGPQAELVRKDVAWGSLAVDFSRDDRRVVYLSHGHCHVVDLASRKSHEWAVVTTEYGGIRCRPGANQAAVLRLIDGKGVVEIRDLDTGAVLAELAHDHPCRSMAWHPAGRLLAVGGEDKLVHVWDVEARKCVRRLTGHQNMGIRVRFNSAGDRLFSTDWDDTTRVWDIATGKQILSNFGWVTGGSPGDDVLTNLTTRVQLLRFVPGREVRTLPQPAMGAPTYSYASATLSRDGRLLAVPTVEPGRTGVALLAWPSMRELARLHEATEPLEGRFDSTGTWWTFGWTGHVLRWPRAANAPSGTIRFGPPEPIASVSQHERQALSPDGRVVVIPQHYQETVIVHAGPRPRVLLTGLQKDVRYAAVSPDGRWVATGSHESTHVGVTAWDARTGRRVKDLVLPGLCPVGFSPDGRWLVTGGGGARLWRTDTWEEGPRVTAEDDRMEAAFSPDSRLLAIGDQGRVRLVRPDTGEEVAQLSLVERRKYQPVCFTPDGGELLVRGENDATVHVWDLRLVRRQLAELGLDWDDLPIADALPEAREVERVELIGAGLVTDAARRQQYQVGWYARALWRNPLDPWACFRLGQALEASHPRAAYALFTAALTLQPDQILAHEYRARIALHEGWWSCAVAEASEILHARPGRARALYPRVMALKRLGRHAEAVADLSTLLRVYPRNADLYEDRASSFQALGETDNAERDWRKAEEVAPDDADRLNNRAWRLLTGPAALRDPAAARKLAERAAQFAPATATYLNTLGVALYRNGQYDRAVRVLQQSLAAGNGRYDGWDLYFLAMCHARLGDRVKAKECFERAEKWVQGHKGLTADNAKELKQFRDEAERALAGTAP